MNLYKFCVFYLFSALLFVLLVVYVWFLQSIRSYSHPQHQSPSKNSMTNFLIIRPFSHVMKRNREVRQSQHNTIKKILVERDVDKKTTPHSTLGTLNNLGHTATSIHNPTMVALVVPLQITVGSIDAITSTLSIRINGILLPPMALLKQIT